ncbi:MAG: response regulator [Thermodesulfobacteriota bacterium]
MQHGRPGPILLVDDQADVSEVLRTALVLEGYEVVVASNGFEALTMIDDLPTPSLIVLDLMMPVMNGWEFREAQLRNPRLADVPTIILSALRSGQTDELLAPAITLAKPLAAERIVETVRSLIGPPDRHG